MRFAHLTPLFAIALLAACSSDGGGGAACNDYSPPASFDPNAPAVSLSKDVMPIVKRSCAITSCHGLPNNANFVYLGGDAATTRAAIVDVASNKLPSMPYVKPGNPRESFLMRKVDASQCALDARCTGGTCGDSMPSREETLPLEERDLFRRWIAQGAKND